MSLYTPPALTAVDFALTAHTVPSIVQPQNVLAPYTTPVLNAVNFALSLFSQPTYPNIGWELLPSIGFPVQIAGLRYFLGVMRELCLVALADAPPGDQWRIRKNGIDYAVYLVDVSDPYASQVRIQTSAGLKAARLKT